MAQPSAPPSYDDAVAAKDDKQPQGYGGGYQQAPPYPLNQPSYPHQGPPKDSSAQPYSPNYATAYNQPGGQGYANPDFPGGVSQPASYQPSQPVGGASEPGFTVGGGSFSDKQVRRLFIRKVFITLAIQLLITFGIVCVFVLVEPVKIFIQHNSVVYYVAYAVFLALYITLACCKSVRRKHPQNIILLILFTLALSYMVGTISSFYDIEAVLIGLGITTGVCTAVILFSIQTKFDFTKCGGLLFVLLLVLILFGFVTIFTYSRPWYLQVVYGSLGALVFSLFLAYDTQLVMGGKRHELNPEEYIYGALTLYIDIVYIFLFILAIFGGSSGN